ncbi:MAG: flavin reductase family protein [Candidatus Eisenbacteria bacterium]|uniref:Flavin reductase family protein n=1 Tax=Eiseniibacteriota bacterium TaxID=2212470 RepID=A0A948RTC2_UNCEI|nr:flavin reductase family protein [Candidatus Eisenbacteria bacterium]MBU1947227.1 flavin reductase family protein [Candidatus Eisenbacteria bacterium]MBU2690510.1 flavin reductase family protein [Candidatus Eisenbacteria bacterium]
MNARTGVKTIDPAGLEPRQLYTLHTELLLPRPIAWISTVSKTGFNNLAPFSFFGGVTSNPPLMGVGIGKGREGGEKDTLKNILDTGEFVINMVDASLIEQANMTAAEFPAHVDEFQIADLTAVPSVKVRPPRVEESPVSMECRVEKILEVGAGPSHFVIGQAILFHIRRDLWDRGNLKKEAYLPIARLGGTAYAHLGEIFHLPRPDATRLMDMQGLKRKTKK